jgi:hypothetical protein
MCKIQNNLQTFIIKAVAEAIYTSQPKMVKPHMNPKKVLHKIYSNQHQRRQP